MIWFFFALMTIQLVLPFLLFRLAARLSVRGQAYMGAGLILLGVLPPLIGYGYGALFPWTTIAILAALVWLVISAVTVWTIPLGLFLLHAARRESRLPVRVERNFSS